MGSILSCGRNRRMKILSRVKSGKKEISRVQEISKNAEWNGRLEDSSKNPARLTVVDFSAPWCPPSNYLEPELDKLASKYQDIDFIKINVDKFKSVAKKFKVDVVPTLVVLKQGKAVNRTKGANITEIKEMINYEKEKVANAEASKPAATN